MLFKSTIQTSLLSLSLAAAASAATVVQTLDEFDVGTFSLSFPNGGNDTGTLVHDHSGSSVLGGRRLSTWDVTANPDSRSADASVVNSPPLSVLFVSTGAAVDATMSLRYGTPVSGPLSDLEQTNANAFQFTFTSLTQTLDLMVTVTDSVGTTYSASVAASSTGDHVLRYTDFPGFAPGDFSSVRVVNVALDSPTLAPDYLLDGFYTAEAAPPVPEPSAALLSLVGAATILLRRKR